MSSPRSTRQRTERRSRLSETETREASGDQPQNGEQLGTLEDEHEPLSLAEELAEEAERGGRTTRTTRTSVTRKSSRGKSTSPSCRR